MNNGNVNRTTEERQQLRWRMAIQRQIELQMNSLIQQMVELVDQQTQVAQSRMEKHQIKNLVAVALETVSVEVVKHYILYQVGRDTPGNSWRHKDFGKTLVGKLDNLRETAQRIARTILADLRELPKPEEQQIDEIWILLVRAYLGQLNRYFYYQKEDTRWQ
ncbi:MAG: hypothetical protein JXR84_06325 [Anaerolineae bacterium]|nr:hypothetical protein [Anaerolineae bacterium]